MPTIIPANGSEPAVEPPIAPVAVVVVDGGDVGAGNDRSDGAETRCRVCATSAFADVQDAEVTTVTTAPKIRTHRRHPVDMPLKRTTGYKSAGEVFARGSVQGIDSL